MDEKWHVNARRVRTIRPGDAGYDAALTASGSGLPTYGVGQMPGASWVAPQPHTPVYPVMQPIAAQAPVAPAPSTGSATATATASSSGVWAVVLLIVAMALAFVGYVSYERGAFDHLFPPKKEQAALGVSKSDKTVPSQAAPQETQQPQTPPQTESPWPQPPVQATVSRSADIPARPPRNLTPSQEQQFMQACMREGRSEVHCGVRFRCYLNRGIMYTNWPGRPAYVPTCNNGLWLPPEAKGVARPDPDWMARFHPDR